MERKSGSLIYISSWNNSFLVLLTSSLPGVGGALIIPHSSAMGEAETVPVGAAGAQVAIPLLLGAASPSWPFRCFPSLPSCFYGILQLPQSICKGEQWLFLCGDKRENKQWMGVHLQIHFWASPAQGVGRSLDICSQREVIKLLLNPIAAGMFWRIPENTGNHKVRLYNPTEMGAVALSQTETQPENTAHRHWTIPGVLQG